MPAKYCSRSECGGKTSYEVKAPLFCSHCGIEYTKAFAVVAIPTQPLETQSVKQGARPAAPISSRNVANYRKPASLRGAPHLDGHGTQDDEDAPIDPWSARTAREQGREIGASISAADFGLTIRAISDTVTIGDLFNNPDRYQVGQRTADLPNIEPPSE